MNFIRLVLLACGSVIVMSSILIYALLVIAAGRALLE